MIKRVLLLAVAFSFSFSLLGHCKELASRALFVSVIENPPVFASLERMNKLVDFAREAGIQTLFVQIYHSGQAWFPSRIADESFYEKYRKIDSTDPFAYLIKRAHAQGIQVHAWINLFSLGSNKQAYFLKKYGTGILTQDLNEKKNLEDYKIDGQYFLEPGDPRVGDDLDKMLQEILNAYPDLDGVQFDYIRYPDVHPHYGYTKINTGRFKESTGLKVIDDQAQVWQDWKRAQVTRVLTKLVKTARFMRPHIQVSTTGCMPYARAYYEAFQDWPSWVSNGLTDFVTIMDYSIDVTQFKKWIMVIRGKTKDFSKVKIAVGAYKLVESPGIFEQELHSCEEMGTTCAIFYYGSILESPPLEMVLTKKET